MPALPLQIAAMSTDVVLGLAKLAETATGNFIVDGILFELCSLAAFALNVDGAGVMMAEDYPRALRVDPSAGQFSCGQRVPGHESTHDRLVIGVQGLDGDKFLSWPKLPAA